MSGAKHMVCHVLSGHARVERTFTWQLLSEIFEHLKKVMFSA